MSVSNMLKKPHPLQNIFAWNLLNSKFKYVTYAFFDFSSFASSYLSPIINAFSMFKAATNLAHTKYYMATQEGRPLVMEMELEEDFEEASGSGCGCGCFKFWWQGHEEEGKRLLEQKGEGREIWVVKKLKKVKELSEVIAGPKWKTFIRKLSGYGKKKQNNRFMYDEHSYALNFNSGAQSEDEDMPPSFSARFSAPFPAGRPSK